MIAKQAIIPVPPQQGAKGFHSQCPKEGRGDKDGRYGRGIRMGGEATTALQMARADICTKSACLPFGLSSTPRGGSRGGGGGRGGQATPPPPWTHTFHNAYAHTWLLHKLLQDSPANQLNAVFIWPACQWDL